MHRPVELTARFLMNSAFAFGLLLALAGLAGISFGLYALLRGGRNGRGGGIG
ncbi:MAG: hypothetical protein H0X23_11190, partial [Rubrobacter sp.]|nr:hypothetical protein [Rubrobacter sp.]